MSKFNEYLKAALIVLEPMVRDCEEAVNGMKRDCFITEARNALRCIKSQLAVLANAEPNEQMLASIDCIVVLSDLFCENKSSAGAMTIGYVMDELYCQLEDLLARRKKLRKKVLKVAA